LLDVFIHVIAACIQFGCLTRVSLIPTLNIHLKPEQADLKKMHLQAELSALYGVGEQLRYPAHNPPRHSPSWCLYANKLPPCHEVC